jgi:hypothetical protein
VSGLDALRHDAQLDPPQVVSRILCKRRVVCFGKG